MMQELTIEQTSTPGEVGFVIELDGSPPVQCMETVRQIPGRRLVCRALWKGETVYAKIFLGAKASYYAGRDRQGMQALAAANIPAPRLLHDGPVVGGSASVLVYQAIENSINAEEAYADMPPQTEQRQQLAGKLVAAVAHHHRFGLMQTDLYLKNFLLQGEEIYTLDGDAIRKFRGLFKERTALNNLALLISKFDAVEADAWLEALLDIYARERHLPDVPDIYSMRKRVAGVRGCVADKYAKRKVFRECTEVQVRRAFTRYLAMTRSLASLQLEQALEVPDELLGDAQLERLKSGNTCTVAMAEIGGRKLVVKRYNIKSFWHGLSRALRQTRAAISWSNAHLLKMHGIATAVPVALLEQRHGIIRRQAYFLTEFVDAPDVDVVFADDNVGQAVKAMVAAEMAELFWKLNLLQIVHGDFKATNVKIVAGQPLLIDLDSMRQHRCRWAFERGHVRDLRRFMLNWRQDEETEALLAEAFRKHYLDARLLRRAGVIT